jgi:hypothetical protein
MFSIPFLIPLSSLSPVSEPDPMAVLSALKRRRTLSSESRHLSAASGTVQQRQQVASAAAAIKLEPLEQEEENGVFSPTAFAAAKAKPYKPKKKDHRRRRRKSGVSSGSVAINSTAGSSGNSCSSSKGWCSEVTPDLKIRIRSPDSRPVLSGSATAITASAATHSVDDGKERDGPESPPLSRHFSLSSPPSARGTAELGCGKAAGEPAPPPGGRKDWIGGGGVPVRHEEEDEEDSAFESNGKFEDDDDLEEEDEAVADVMVGVFPSHTPPTRPYPSSCIIKADTVSFSAVIQNTVEWSFTFYSIAVLTVSAKSTQIFHFRVIRRYPLFVALNQRHVVF